MNGRTGVYLLVLALVLLYSAAWAKVGDLEIREILPLQAEQRVKLVGLVQEDAEARELFELRKAAVTGLLEKEPRPLKVIHYEGLVNTDPRRLETVQHLQDMDDLAALFEVWQVTGEERLAERCRRYILAWTGSYIPTGNDVNENKLSPVLVAWLGLKEGFSKEDAERIRTWMEEMGGKHAPVVREKQGELTNRYTKSLRLLYLLGEGAGREEWKELAFVGFQRFVTESLRAEGGSADLERRDTLTYHCSGLRPLLSLALLAPKGEAWFGWESPQGGSVKKSVEYVIPYAQGTKTRKEWVNSVVELDRKRAAAGLEEYRIGRLFEPVQALPMLEEASRFDQELVELVLKLQGGKVRRFGSWRMVLNEVMRN
ncbi:MAG: hypothetical protein HC904_01825 [Blastochloris sp.]|nr:hypothetical protein [Blastochloris sp.]